MKDMAALFSKVLAGLTVMLLAGSLLYFVLCWLLSPEWLLARPNAVTAQFEPSTELVTAKIHTHRQEIQSYMNTGDSVQLQLQGLTDIASLFEGPKSRDIKAARLAMGVVALTKKVKALAQEQSKSSPAFKHVVAFATNFTEEVTTAARNGQDEVVRSKAKAWWHTFGGVLDLAGRNVSALKSQLQGTFQSLQNRIEAVRVKEEALEKMKSNAQAATTRLTELYEKLREHIQRAPLSSGLMYILTGLGEVGRRLAAMLENLGFSSIVNLESLLREEIYWLCLSIWHVEPTIAFATLTNIVLSGTALIFKGRLAFLPVRAGLQLAGKGVKALLATAVQHHPPAEPTLTLVTEYVDLAAITVGVLLDVAGFAGLVAYCLPFLGSLSVNISTDVLGTLNFGLVCGFALLVAYFYSHILFRQTVRWARKGCRAMWQARSRWCPIVIGSWIVIALVHTIFSTGWMAPNERIVRENTSFVGWSIMARELLGHLGPVFDSLKMAAN